MALDKFQPYLFVSAGEQSNKFLTPAYADGIAQFQAQRAQFLTGLTVRIEPIQEGTGDPSPTNIRPISGRTGLTVTRAGKNLFDDHSLRQGGGYWFNFNPSQTQRCSAVNLIPVLPNTQYTLSKQSGNLRVAIQQYRNASTVQDVNPVIADSGWRLDTYTFTTEAEVHYVWLTFSSINYEYDITDADVQACKLQFEMSSTATAYEPYDGQTYPISWQTEAGTVYGGTLDVVSGVLTVTHKVFTISGGAVLYGNYGIDNAPIYYVEIDTQIMPYSSAIPQLAANKLQCNKYAATTEQTPLEMKNEQIRTREIKPTEATGSTNRIYIRDDRFTTAADLNADLASTPAVVVARLAATPQTYQLTGAEVRTIAGFNQIYSDAGPVIDIKF